MENARLWKETADELGMSLEDLLTVISYETAGSMDPMQLGPTTKWGRHRGLIQFGEPQAKQYGVDFSSREAALNSQLGKDGAIVKYMRASGYDPEIHGFENMYATINAGNPNKVHASDAHAGGAWGSVRDKVNYQMAGHREKAQGLVAGMNFGPEIKPDGSISRGLTRPDTELIIREDGSIGPKRPETKKIFRGDYHPEYMAKHGIDPPQAGINERANKASSDSSDYEYKQPKIGGKAHAGLHKMLGGDEQAGKRMSGLGQMLMAYGFDMLQGA